LPTHYGNNGTYRTHYNNNGSNSSLARLRNVCVFMVMGGLALYAFLGSSSSEGRSSNNNNGKSKTGLASWTLEQKKQASLANSANSKLRTTKGYLPKSVGTNSRDTSKEEKEDPYVVLQKQQQQQQQHGGGIMDAKNIVHNKDFDYENDNGGQGSNKNNGRPMEDGSESVDHHHHHGGKQQQEEDGEDRHKALPPMPDEVVHQQKSQEDEEHGGGEEEEDVDEDNRQHESHDEQQESAEHDEHQDENDRDSHENQDNEEHKTEEEHQGDYQHQDSRDGEKKPDSENHKGNSKAKKKLSEEEDTVEQEFGDTTSKLESDAEIDSKADGLEVLEHPESSQQVDESHGEMTKDSLLSSTTSTNVTTSTTNLTLPAENNTVISPLKWADAADNGEGKIAKDDSSLGDTKSSGSNATTVEVVFGNVTTNTDITALGANASSESVDTVVTSQNRTSLEQNRTSPEDATSKNHHYAGEDNSLEVIETALEVVSDSSSQVKKDGQDPLHSPDNKKDKVIKLDSTNKGEQAPLDDAADTNFQPLHTKRKKKTKKNPSTKKKNVEGWKEAENEFLEPIRNKDGGKKSSDDAETASLADFGQESPPEIDLATKDEEGEKAGRAKKSIKKQKMTDSGQKVVDSVLDGKDKKSRHKEGKPKRTAASDAETA
jgi:hypothetical protein